MNKKERSIIVPVTIGSLLERYEVYLYIYWAPIISKEFFDSSLPIVELITAVLVLLVGFLARPLGGLVFGYIGDRWGRKKAFILSILILSIPSFATALTPSYNSWNTFAIVYIGIAKFLQGLPAGGELPGAICFLSECSPTYRRRYVCSYTFIGPQIGQTLSMVQCLLLERFLSHHDLIHWGWRVSFFIGGTIGILGFFLRSRLHESPAFKDLQNHHSVLHNPLKETFTHHRGAITKGFFISILEVVGFFVIAFFIVAYSSKVLKLSTTQTLIFNLIAQVFITVLLPFLGKLGDRVKNRPLYIFSAVGILITSVPFYYSITNSLLGWSLTFLIIISLILCIQFALLPTLISELFPTRVRFTCIGFSFNLCDSVVGGLSPILAILLVRFTGNPASFVILFPISAIIFLITLRFIDVDKPLKKLKA